jgi:AcrR family transcriptional regulator
MFSPPGPNPKTTTFPNSTLLFLKMQASFLDQLSFPPGQLPAGRHSLTREVVLASQRGRLLDAMAQAVADRGYGATTVAHVVARAGVSRKTFYEHFSDKEDCFLALYDTGIAYVLGRIVEAVGDGSFDSEPHARLAAGLQAFLDVLAEEPAFSRAIIREVHAAGAQAAARRRATLEAFAQRYEEINAQVRAKDPSIPPLGHDAALAVVGAILELVAIWIDDDRARRLRELTGLLTDFVERHVAPRATA